VSTAPVPGQHTASGADSLKAKRLADRPALDKEGNWRGGVTVAATSIRPAKGRPQPEQSAYRPYGDPEDLSIRANLSLQLLAQDPNGNQLPDLG
jgi:hypothetical protein